MDTLVSLQFNLAIAACVPTKVVLQTRRSHRHLSVEPENGLLVARRGHKRSSVFTLGPSMRYAFRAAGDASYLFAEAGGEVTAAARRIGPGSELDLVWVDRKEGLFALRIPASTRELYLQAADGGGGPVHANATTIVPEAVFSLIRRWGGRYAIRTGDGRHYLRAVDGGGGQVLADRTHIGIEETFHLASVPTVDVALRTPDGFYLSGHSEAAAPMTADRLAVGEGEQLRLVPLDEETMGIRCNAGCLFAQVEADGHLWSKADSPLAAGEKFRVEAVGPDRIVLRAEMNGRYVVAAGESVTAGAPKAELATLFTVVPEPEVMVNVLGPDGMYYLSAESGGGGPLYANAQSAEAWETFALTPVPGMVDEFRLRTAAGQYVAAEDSGRVAAVSLEPTPGCDFRIDAD